MDSKKKLPVKKVGKRQLKNYALLDGVSVSDMTREQLETSVYQLQQEVEKETEERNYCQMERDRIQLFWEVTKHQLEEKDAILRLKDTELDEARLTHLAEIKLYEQKMKHLMFECQQDIHKKMKEKMGEKLIADEEHQEQINFYTNEVNELKDGIFKLQLEHEDVVLNQRLKHGQELCELHEKYQKEMDEIKMMEVAEIGKIRDVLNTAKDKAIQEIEDQKDLHMEHLTQQHQELFLKMKNFYNDIIKNDILLIRSLNKKLKQQESEVNYHQGKVKKLMNKTEELEKEIKELQQLLEKRKENIECNSKLYGTDSAIRNLRREIKALKSENEILHLKFLKGEQQSLQQGCYFDFQSSMTNTNPKPPHTDPIPVTPYKVEDPPTIECIPILLDPQL